ncbi:suppressor of fused domain protein [Sphingomonas sp. AR_OL41]|uniref:suppressor of fused domain protein n=1 Tax=Sphingomonas sp. AR_OL41 TaxID=3042729 RepID=UPI0024813184|nr:suppressor of fused domain protein [Sphingomonas sp. AR_OL41]MDH7971276.1 suppressor of fused domain protein [Sphingomonas sp. AR_OL41]
MKREEAISSHTKSAARELARAWGGQPIVHRHWDEPEENWISIAARAECPWDGVTAFGTLGLSEHSVRLSNDLRVEIIGACATATDLSDVLATCAFNVIKDAWPMRPGAFHNDVLKMYGLSETLAHVMFVPSFLWDDGPKTLHLEGRTITWLMAVPISESELVYAEREGSDALNALLKAQQIDIFDINRLPTL